MKTFFKILFILVILILALMFVLPIIFEEEIEDLARTEINKNVNATVDFDGANLSLFKNFPHFTLGIDGISVIGKDEFQQDTLARIANISVTLDLFSVIKSDAYEIKKISVNSPDIKVRILKTGQTNYDISLPAEAESEALAEESAPFKLLLNEVSINNCKIVYLDEESDIKTYITGLNSALSGDLTADVTVLRTNTTIESLTVFYEGIKYLSNSKLRYQANIDADITNEIYTLGKNELVINDLFLSFDGSVSYVQEGMNLVLTFNAPKNKFKSLLSLVPVVYTTDFEGLQADGDFSMGGNIKGIYNDDKLPAFNIDLAVKNGYFKYPDLPSSVEKINIETNISNPGTNTDATLIDISKFEMTMGNNPVSARMKLKTPVSDPDIDGQIKGEIDLSSVKNYYPLEEGENLSGSFVVDVTLKGKLSSIEKEQYDQFIALGSMLVKDLIYNSPGFKEPINISTSQLNFSPQYLDLVSFKMNTGPSDFSASGKIENYLAYVFADGKLTGKMNTQSTYFNLDEMMGDEAAEEDTAEAETGSESGTESSSVVFIPDNIDFVLTSGFNTLIYDNLEMNNVSGTITVRDETLNLKNLKSGIIGGLFTLNGTYSTKNQTNPKVNFDFDLKGVDIPTSYDKFALVRQYLPIAKKTKGKMSSAFSFSTNLDKDMMPVYETLNGKGQISTTDITLEGMNTLVQIADALFYEDLKNMKLTRMLIEFEFINGKMVTQPFDLKYKNINAQVEGWTALDQTIGYTMGMDVPLKSLGADANKLFDNIAKEAATYGINYKLPETVKVGIKIGGTLTNPKISTDLNQVSADLLKQAKDALLNKVSQELQAQADKILAEADKAAKKIMDEAKKQADALRKSADDAIKQLNAETDKQANALMAEAKKQGALAEMAAKETVKKLRSEADKKINGLRSEADKKADALLNEAQKQSDGIRQKAKNESDALLKK